MGKHLLAKVHIAKLNEFTESEVIELSSPTVDETAFVILKMEGSRGITIVRSQRKIIFHIQVDPYWPKWQTKHSKLAAKDFETSQFHQDTWNRYLMLGLVSAHIPWNGIWNVQLQRSYKALRDDRVLPSATTLSNICLREYVLAVDAMMKQLPSWKKISLALDGWTWMNKQVIPPVITYYMDRNWGLWEYQLAFNKVHHISFSHFES